MIYEISTPIAFQTICLGGNFSRYNYGETGNMERYGKTEAPKYQLELVTAPVYLVYGQTDGVASPQVFIKIV